MYAQHFGLKQDPFSIAPDPRYLFMSERHREALAHLLYGLDGGGGFVLLSGEIGTGKTTVCRCFLEQIPAHCNVAYIFNPKLTVNELLRSVCDEFHVARQPQLAGLETAKDLTDALNAFLLRAHAAGQNNVLIIDEAQNLSADVLEQLRLLTNLETNERKLLQIVLIGQPELRTLLARPELEQLAQRVIARFHLQALSEAETAQYIAHRLSVAGMAGAVPFDARAIRRIHQLTRGVPRRINLLCGRALLGAYATGQATVDRGIVDKAAAEVFGEGEPRAGGWWNTEAGRIAAVVAAAVLVVAGVVAWALRGGAAPAAAVAARTTASAPQPAASTAPPTAAVTRAPSSAPSAPRAAASAGAPPSPSAAAAADLLARFKAPLRDEAGAWRALAAAWNVQLGDGEPCAAAQRAQVRCFRSASSLAQIRVLDRPGIVTLQDAGARPAYALLTALDERTATLRMGADSVTVPIASLAAVWRGDFATLWRAPAGYVRKPIEGAGGEPVDWLAKQLAAVEGRAAPNGPQVLDKPLQARVRAFQLAHGLKADGLPGAPTFMQLNRAIGVDEPRLAAPARTEQQGA